MTRKIQPGDIAVIVPVGTKVKIGKAQDKVLVIEEKYCPEGHVYVGTYEEVMRAFRTAVQMVPPPEVQVLIS